MGVFFGKEIIEAAVQIERNGLAFYESMAQQAGAEEARKVFGDLATEEKKHIQELDDFSKSLPDPPDTWEREEFGMYLNELAESHIFRDGTTVSKMKESVSTELDAVDLGIRFEKDTLLFMDGLQQMVRPKDKTVVQRLLEWERGHLLRLVQLKWHLTGRSRERK